MNELIQQFTSLSEDRRQLILKRLQQQRRSTTDNKQQLSPIVPVPRDRELPLSFSQLRFWLVDKFTSSDGNANMSVPIIVRLKGALNSNAIHDTFNEIVRRHEVFRTSFPAVDGEPRLVIASSLSLAFPYIDMTGVPTNTQSAEVRGIINQELRRPFNLSVGPAARLFLFRLTAEEHILCFILHHIISDGWSFGILTRELMTIYSGYTLGVPSPLSEPTVQYADFAYWQRQWLQKEVLESQLDYWKRKLADPPPTLNLHTDRPRSLLQTFQAAKQGLTLSRSLTLGLKELTRREGGTMFMTLLSAFGALIQRYTGQEDICIGTIAANRNRSEIEGIIGPFLNTLVLRVDLSGNPTLRELVRRVRQVTLEAYANQDVPFEQILQGLNSDRDLSFTSLFRVMFGMHTESNTLRRLFGSAVPDTSQPSGLKIQPFDTTKKYRILADLGMSIEEENDELVVYIECNADLFDTITIVKMMMHYQTLLEGMVQNADQFLSTARLLTPPEQHQLLVEWNSTSDADPKYTSIGQLFEVQMDQSPEAVAVVFDNRHLTYYELDSRANRLARYLQMLQVGSDDIVGVYLERSLELMVGVLSVVKAGAAYLPLDSAYPLDRLSYMIGDAHVRVILTQAQMAVELSTLDATVVCIDSEWKHIAEESEGRPAIDVTHQNGVYVIYTSGSTGTPKGAMITHGSLINAYRAWENTYGLRTLIKCHLQMTSFSFDVFTGDWVRSLCAGAKLVLCPQLLLVIPDELYQLMRQEQVDCAEFIPDVLRNLVQYLQETQQLIDFMRLLVTGSDTWYAGEYRELQSYCGPETRLINSYGVSESTIDSSYFEYPGEDLPPDKSIPIGRPFNGTQVHLLDRLLQPVPAGIPGELYIGGIGLARGYLEREGLTADRFVPNPFSQESGARLYKTGDLACYRPDGTIKLLGRLDHQVKIRGIRIELGEIEALLNQHPAVQKNVVIAREDGTGNNRLVAYLIINRQLDITPLNVSDYLRKHLPEYMVPSAIVLLDALPLTPNGKVDRKALPPPNEFQFEEQSEFVAPQTPLEKRLAEIWSELLKVDRIGIYDNFFRLGGHSLMAVRVIHRTNQTFPIQLSVRHIFEEPTIIGLSLLIEEILLEKLEAELEFEAEEQGTENDMRAQTQVM